MNPIYKEASDKLQAALVNIKERLEVYSSKCDIDKTYEDIKNYIIEDAVLYMIYLIDSDDFVDDEEIEAFVEICDGKLPCEKLLELIKESIAANREEKKAYFNKVSNLFEYLLNIDTRYYEAVKVTDDLQEIVANAISLTYIDLFKTIGETIAASEGEIAKVEKETMENYISLMEKCYAENLEIK